MGVLWKESPQRVPFVFMIDVGIIRGVALDITNGSYGSYTVSISKSFYRMSL